MRRVLLLGSLIYLLVLVGLAAFQRSLLVLAIPLVVYLAAALLLSPGQPQVAVERTVTPDRVVEGTPVAVRLSITNQGPLPAQLTVEDDVPARLRQTGGRPRAAALLGPGQTLDVEYAVLPPRGAYNFQDGRVVSSDPLGLLQREVVLAAPASLLVLPRFARLRRLSIRPQRTRGHAGPVPARLGGSGVDFYGVREYQAGDAQRWINWRASARHPTALFTNEFEQERIADVGLILDARLRSDVVIGPESLFEHGVHAAAALADVFLRDGNRVALLVFGQFVQWTFPGYGKVQRERLLRALARAKPGDSRVFDSLENLPTRLFPAGSQLVLVSPVARDDVPTLLHLRARGYQLLVIRPDPVSLELRGLSPEPAVELAGRIRSVERTLVRRRLLRAGVQVVDWRVDIPFEQVVHGSLRRVPAWVRGVRG